MRRAGKVAELEHALQEQPLAGRLGIAHTRWATHGAPTAANAHPHATGVLALVHNGIIENFRQLRDALTARGRRFESDTDTEVVAHLLSEQVEAGLATVADRQAPLAASRSRIVSSGGTTEKSFRRFVRVKEPGWPTNGRAITRAT